MWFCIILMRERRHAKWPHSVVMRIKVTRPKYQGRHIQAGRPTWEEKVKLLAVYGLRCYC